MLKKIFCFITIISISLCCCSIAFAEELEQTIVLRENNDIKKLRNIRIVGDIQMDKPVSFTVEECEQKALSELPYMLGLEHLDCACKVMLWSSNQITNLKNSEKERKKENTNSSNIKVVMGELDTPIKSIDDIENMSEHIVKGKILEGSENILTEYGGGYTKTNLEITDVYKGDLKVGEVIPLTELYYTSKDGTEIRREGYCASEVGKEYLFYLGKQYNDGTYGVVCTALGRYSLEDTQALSDDVDFIESNVVEELIPLYKKLKSEVMDIYKNSSNQITNFPNIMIPITDYEPIESISDIEKVSNCIVKAKALEGKENVIPEGSGMGYTKINLEITDVYKGDLKVGDVIPFMERYFVNGGTEYRRDGYTASEVGKEYLFYLGKFDNGLYDPVCTVLGRYFLEDTQALNDDVDSIESSVAEEYLPLYKQLKSEVMDIYKDK